VFILPGKLLEETRRVGVAACNLEKGLGRDVHNSGGAALVWLVLRASVPGLCPLLVGLMHAVARTRITYLQQSCRCLSRIVIFTDPGSVGDPDPGSVGFFTPGSGIPNPGSQNNIYNRFCFNSLLKRYRIRLKLAQIFSLSIQNKKFSIQFHFWRHKRTIIFPSHSCLRFLILDPGLVKIFIRDKHPGSATLHPGTRMKKKQKRGVGTVWQNNFHKPEGKSDIWLK
jgi:hypothetical protein